MTTDKRVTYYDQDDGTTIMKLKRPNGEDVEILIETAYIQQVKEYTWYSKQQTTHIEIYDKNSSLKLSNLLYQLQHPHLTVDPTEQYDPRGGIQKITETKQQMDYRKGQLITRTSHREYEDVGNGVTLMKVYDRVADYNAGKPSAVFKIDTQDKPLLYRIPKIYKMKGSYQLKNKNRTNPKDYRSVQLHIYLYHRFKTYEDTFKKENMAEGTFTFKDNDKYNLTRENILPYDRKKNAPHLLPNWNENLKKRYTQEYRGKLASNPTPQILNQEQVNKIREMNTKGMIVADIEKETGYTRQTISDILHYRTWNELRYEGSLEKEEAENLVNHTYEIRVTGDNERENINVDKFRQNPIARYKLKDTPYYVNTKVIGEYQYFMEFFHNGHYIGCTQITMGTPNLKQLQERRKSVKNIVIQQMNRDRYGYAKEQDVILNRAFIYEVLNSINDFL